MNRSFDALVLKLTRRLVRALPAGPATLRSLLEVDNLLYEEISRLAIQTSPDGRHPKHRLLGYMEWFAAQISAQATVVDVGSNTGAMVRVLAERCAHVYGIEIDERLSAEARLLGVPANAEFICADATTYDYGAVRPVDVVTLSNVLEHIADRPEFLTQLVDSVPWSEGSPNLLVRVPMFDREWLVPFKREHDVEWRLDQTHCTEYTERSFADEVASAGLSVATSEIRFGELYAVLERG